MLVESAVVVAFFAVSGSKRAAAAGRSKGDIELAGGVISAGRLIAFAAWADRIKIPDWHFGHLTLKACGGILLSSSCRRASQFEQVTRMVVIEENSLVSKAERRDLRRVVRHYSFSLGANEII